MINIILFTFVPLVLGMYYIMGTLNKLPLSPKRVARTYHSSLIAAKMEKMELNLLLVKSALVMKFVKSITDITPKKPHASVSLLLQSNVGLCIPVVSVVGISMDVVPGYNVITSLFGITGVLFHEASKTNSLIDDLSLDFSNLLDNLDILFIGLFCVVGSYLPIIILAMGA